MANCKIDKGSAFTCDSIEQAGIKSYLYLINFEDFENNQTLTFDTGATEEITALVLASGTQGYKFEASKGSVQIIPNVAFRGVTAKDGFDHILDIRIPETTQVSRENIKKLRFQKVVAIIPLQNGKFELYGRRVGMRINDYQENPGDADISGSIQFVLSTPENDPPEIDPSNKIADTFDITSLDSPAT